MIKSRRMKLAGQIARMGDWIGAYWDFVRRSEGIVMFYLTVTLKFWTLNVYFGILAPY
jgi:hypothetical protein